MKYLIPLFLCGALLCVTSCSQGPSYNPQAFRAWLADFKKDALAQGVSPQTLDDAFANTAAPLDRVIALDRKQPESVLTLEEYLHNTVSEKRVQDGRQALADNQILLDKIGAQYGVQPKFIVALWGIETNYGRNTGGFETVDALATLAYDGRRSDYFRGELIKALKILDSEHMSASDMKGSWAGALGQCQFMPSSFLNFAVDYDGDGKRDIWNSEADVFASIANYLASSGWNAAQNADEGSANYKVLLKWNRSRFFATAVGTLADEISQ